MELQARRPWAWPGPEQRGRGGALREGAGPRGKGRGRSPTGGTAGGTAGGLQDSSVWGGVSAGPVLSGGSLYLLLQAMF